MVSAVGSIRSLVFLLAVLACCTALTACCNGRSQPETRPNNSGPTGPDPVSTAGRGNPEQVRAAVSRILDSWINAQTSGDADAYFSLYEPSFTGIKRTRDGGEKRMNLGQWRQDRSPMLAGRPRVAADHRHILSWLKKPALGEGMIEVRFIQRYQAGSYADHGPKLLRMKWNGGAPRISYEEMLSSAPGWFDGPADATLDASGMTSPITVKLVGQPQGGDPPRGTVQLTLTDARGTTKAADLGEYVGVQSEEFERAKGGSTLYDVLLWWAGAGTRLRVLRDGSGVVVKEREEQETGGDPNAPSQLPTKDLLRVTLPANAVVR